jgi:hypothetical protein
MHAVRFLPSRCRSPNSAPSQAFPPFLGLSHFLLFSHIKSLVILADILAGYTTSAPPTFLAKFLLGLAVAFIAHKVFNLAAADDKKATKIVTIAAVFGCLVNVITEPLIRYGFKVFVLGLPHQIAYLSAINCAVSMAVSAVPSVILAVFLYKAVQHSILKSYKFV